MSPARGVEPSGVNKPRDPMRAAVARALAAETNGQGLKNGHHIGPAGAQLVRFDFLWVAAQLLNELVPGQTVFLEPFPRQPPVEIPCPDYAVHAREFGKALDEKYGTNSASPEDADRLAMLTLLMETQARFTAITARWAARLAEAQQAQPQPTQEAFPEPPAAPG